MLTLFVTVTHLQYFKTLDSSIYVFNANAIFRQIAVKGLLQRREFPFFRFLKWG